MTRLATTLLVLLPLPAFAAGGIEVTRGPDSTSYGSCVPSLQVMNNSSETVDYLQVDVLLDLTDGQKRIVELKSAYREGVLYPIAPGVGATLRQHLDTSQAIGVQCSAIKTRTAGPIVCEANGKPCTAPVSVQP